MAVSGAPVVRPFSGLQRTPDPIVDELGEATTRPAPLVSRNVENAALRVPSSTPRPQATSAAFRTPSGGGVSLRSATGGGGSPLQRYSSTALARTVRVTMPSHYPGATRSSAAEVSPPRGGAPGQQETVGSVSEIPQPQGVSPSEEARRAAQRVTSAVRQETPSDQTQSASPGAGPSAPRQERFETSGGTPIVAVSNADYDPQTTSRLLEPSDSVLAEYLRRSNDKPSCENGENTNRKAVEYGVRCWAKRPTSKEALARMGVEDLEQLSPKQAVAVSSQIAQDMMEYWHEAIEDTPEAAKLAEQMDSWGVQSFFRKDRNGVCRNYAEVVQGVYGVLRRMQVPLHESQLMNTHAKVVYSRPQRGMGHAWNAFYTVQSDGSVMVTQTDATWNDTSRAGETRGDDYTFGEGDIREYWRTYDLMKETGHRELEAFQRRFDNGTGLGSWAGSGQIGIREVDAAGGVAALADAFVDMPRQLHPRAFAMLDIDAKEAVTRHMRQRKLERIQFCHPAGY